MNLQKEKKKLKIPEKPFQMNDETLKEYNNLIKTEDINNGAQSLSTQNKKNLNVNVNSFHPSPEVINDFYMSFINQLNLDTYPIQKKDQKKDKRSQFQKFFEHFQTEYGSEQFEEKQNDQMEIKNIINTSSISAKQKSNAIQVLIINQQKQNQKKDKIIEVNTSKPVRKPLRNPFKKDADQPILINEAALIPLHDQINGSKLQIWKSSLNKQEDQQKDQGAESVFPSKLIFNQFSPIREPREVHQSNMPKGKQKVKGRVQPSTTVVQHQAQTWTRCLGVSCQMLPKSEHGILFRSFLQKPLTRQELINACGILLDRNVAPPNFSDLQIQQLTQFQVEIFRFQIFQWKRINDILWDLSNNLVEENYKLFIRLIHLATDRNMCQVLNSTCFSELNIFLQTEYVYVALVIIFIETISFGDCLSSKLITSLLKSTLNIELAYKQTKQFELNYQEFKQKMSQQEYQAYMKLYMLDFQIFDMYDLFTKNKTVEDRIYFEKQFDFFLMNVACQYDEILYEENKNHNRPQEKSKIQKDLEQQFRNNIQIEMQKYFKQIQFARVQNYQFQENPHQGQFKDQMKQDLVQKPNRIHSQNDQEENQEENQDENSLILNVIQIDMNSVNDKECSVIKQKVSVKQEEKKAIQNQEDKNQNQKKQVKVQNEIKTQKQRTDEAKQKKWDNIQKQKEIEAAAKQAKLDKKMKKQEIQQAQNPKQDTDQQNAQKQEPLQKVSDQLQDIDKQKEQFITQTQIVPQELSKRQQKKLARQKAELEKQLLEQQQKEQFEKERQPQPYTVEKMQDILKNTNYDAFNSPQWTNLLQREPIVEVIQRQKLCNYKKQNVQTKKKYHFKNILRKKSQQEEFINNEYGQLKIIRYAYSLNEVFKLKEFKACIRWFNTYNSNLNPKILQIQEITLLLNKIHPQNIERLLEEILKYIPQKQYQLGKIVDLLMKRIIYDIKFHDCYLMFAIKLKDQLKLKDQQQTILLNKSYILLLQQTLSKQIEIFLNQDGLLDYFDNCIKIVESFWSVDIIDEYYISELILSMLLKIEQEGKEHQIIMLVILLNRVFNKYKKFVDHYQEVHPQAIQLESRINLLTLQDIIDKIKCIPMERLTSKRCQILIENIQQQYCGNLKCMIAEDIQPKRSHEGNQQQRQIQQINQQRLDDENIKIQQKVRNSCQLDYEEQYYALEGLLVYNQSYTSQTQIFKELFYQIFQYTGDERKNSLVIYKLVIHRKTLLLSVQKGSQLALELLKNRDLYHPQHLYNIWKGILKPLLDKLQSYELSYVSLLIDPSNQDQDQYFKNLTLDLIMDSTKNGRRNLQEKIKMLLDYKDECKSQKQLFDMTESFFMTGNVQLEEDCLLQTKLYERILVSIFQNQFVKSSQLIDLIKNTQNFQIRAFKMACEWAFDYIVSKRIDEFADILYDLLFNLADNDLFEIVTIIGLDKQYYFILDRLVKNLPNKRRQLIACL
ncbi:hypothetical protein pb186bvf_012045 [Paramecium bursaria]